MELPKHRGKFKGSAVGIKPGVRFFIFIRSVGIHSRRGFLFVEKEKGVADKPRRYKKPRTTNWMGRSGELYARSLFLLAAAGFMPEERERRR